MRIASSLVAGDAPKRTLPASSAISMPSSLPHPSPTGDANATCYESAGARAAPRKQGLEHAAPGSARASRKGKSRLFPGARRSGPVRRSPGSPKTRRPVSGGPQEKLTMTPEATDKSDAMTTIAVNGPEDGPPGCRADLSLTPAGPRGLTRCSSPASRLSCPSAYGSAAALLRTGAPGPIEADHLGDQSLVGPKQVGGNASARSAVTSGDPLPDYHLYMRYPSRREPGLGHWLATHLLIAR